MTMRLPPPISWSDLRDLLSASVPLCYLLHFEPGGDIARHYLGSTVDLIGLYRLHTLCGGAGLVEVAVAAHCYPLLVAVWEVGSTMERRLKLQRHRGRFCPISRRSWRLMGKPVLR